MRKKENETLPEFIAEKQTELVKDNQIHKAIRQQQLKLLDKTFLSLATVIYSGADEYVKQNANSDYRSFIDYLVGVFERYDSEEPTIAIKQEEIPETPEKRQEILNSYWRTVEQLNSFYYQPPSDPWEILTHLQTLYRLLTDRKPDFSITETILSMSFAKLLAAASDAKARQITRDSRELPRSAKSSRARKGKAQGKKEIVLRIYHHLKAKNSLKKMTLNAVANAVKKDWDKFPPLGSEKSPGLTTIKDYLRQEPQIMEELTV